jgi:protein-S-isoprenylcysteine O-methyltransferase Ste14
MTIVGALCIAAGEALRLWGVAHIGAVSRTRADGVSRLVDSGPFAWSRNPLYIGNLTMWLGVGLLAGRPVVAVLVVAALALHYRFVVAWEEQNLRAQLGAPYEAYAARVSRWIGPGGSGEGAADWAGALRSERSTLLAAAVILVALRVRLMA